MIVAFRGTLGAGKSLGLTVFGWYYSLRAGGAPLMANFALNERYFNRHRQANPRFALSTLTEPDDLVQFVAGGGGILLLDELHRMLDSRLSVASVNVYLSQFFMYLRKLGITVFLASQHELNFDRRVRMVIDVMVTAKKHESGYSYDLWDHQANQHLRRLWLPEATAARFRGAYDSYELVRGLKFPSTQKGFDAFLETLDKARPRRRAWSTLPARSFGAEVDQLLGEVAGGGS